MSYEDTIIDALVDGAYNIINHMNAIEFYDIGLFTWLIIMFVAGFVVDLLRRLIFGGGSENGQ